MCRCEDYPKYELRKLQKQCILVLKQISWTVTNQAVSKLEVYSKMMLAIGTFIYRGHLKAKRTFFGPQFEIWQQTPIPILRDKYWPKLSNVLQDQSKKFWWMWPRPLRKGQLICEAIFCDFKSPKKQIISNNPQICNCGEFFGTLN